MDNMLTVQDILRVTFKKSIRGYDKDEVDRFLDNVIDTIQKYTDSLSYLEQQHAKDQKKLEEYTQISSVLHDTLLMAQKSADEKTAAAQAEAERIIAEAEAKAESIRNGAYDEQSELCEQLARIKEIRDLYMTEARSLIVRYDDILCKALHPTGVSAEAEAIVKEYKEQCAEDSVVANEETAQCKTNEPQVAKDDVVQYGAEEVMAEEQPEEKRFEYTEINPSDYVPENASKEPVQHEDAFRLYDSEEFTTTDVPEIVEKSAEELDAEQLAAAEKLAFEDKNQQNLFGEDVDPTKVRKEIHYAKADSLDD